MAASALWECRQNWYHRRMAFIKSRHLLVILRWMPERERWWRTKRKRKLEKFEVYRHWNRHGIGMWKCYLFGSGGIRCLFLIPFRKIEHFRKKVAKSFAESGILLTFAVRVGADGKERLRWRLKWMSVLNVSLEIEMWKFQYSTMTNCNTAHAMGLLYPFLYRRKVPIYLLAWAIVSC